MNYTLILAYFYTARVLNEWGSVSDYFWVSYLYMIYYSLIYLMVFFLIWKDFYVIYCRFEMIVMGFWMGLSWVCDLLLSNCIRAYYDADCVSDLWIWYKDHTCTSFELVLSLGSSQFFYIDDRTFPQFCYIDTSIGTSLKFWNLCNTVILGAILIDFCNAYTDWNFYNTAILILLIDNSSMLSYWFWNWIYC